MGFGNLTVIETPSKSYYVQMLLRLKKSAIFSVQAWVPGCGPREQQLAKAKGQALAHVISELVKKKGKPPFRNSKLTYILKESLCGNSKTIMMAAISPSLADYDETLSTLNFAKSVKKVQTKATANVMSSETLEQMLRKEVEALRSQLESAQGQHDELKALQDKVAENNKLLAFYGVGAQEGYDSLRAEDKALAQKRKTMMLDRSQMISLGTSASLLMEDEDEDDSGEEWDGQDSSSSEERGHASSSPSKLLSTMPTRSYLARITESKPTRTLPSMLKSTVPWPATTFACVARLRLQATTSSSQRRS